MVPTEQLSEDVVIARAIVTLLESGALSRKPRAIAQAADACRVSVDLIRDQWHRAESWRRDRAWTSDPQRVARRPLPDAARIFAALHELERSTA